MNDLEKLFELFMNNPELKDLVTNKKRLFNMTHKGLTPALEKAVFGCRLLEKYLVVENPHTIGTGTVIDKDYVLRLLKGIEELLYKCRNTLAELYGFTFENEEYDSF